MSRFCNLVVEIEYDPAKTNPDELANLASLLLHHGDDIKASMALANVGNPNIGTVQTWDDAVKADRTFGIFCLNIGEMRVETFRAVEAAQKAVVDSGYPDDFVVVEIYGVPNNYAEDDCEEEEPEDEADGDGTV